MNKLYYHMPYGRLQTNMDFVVKNKINIEIYFDAQDIDQAKESGIKEIAKKLCDHNVSVIFHAPFRGLNLGSFDEKLRQLTIERLLSLFEYAPFFKASSMVIHSGFDQIYHDKIKDKWMDIAEGSLSLIKQRAEEMNFVVSVENAIEHSLELIAEIVDRQNSKNIKMCLDVGHYHVFCREKYDVCEAINRNRNRIYEFHLSDNFGKEDEHLALGQGRIDFKKIFSKIKELGMDPVFTVESHSDEDILKSKKYLKKC